ncbi:hypothetical protein EIN_117890 [Entamoeba invadens IP1]|uniref:Uncharacterized protein n=1 Tax=Entamoeba invadens IP1 TaxID=370355 RepID=L7FPV0_ENTIV|nr:hypothetical protein EIN_117890 [Entamoeba invadens IP1]ELP92215.1 hypothetical protein EIN_117890 [Entamoeba invadens IP1]|eukprot:XP_004258986.1 hypothetical protein EIN_117890 [Entamoeba invadens IP1]
MSKPKFVSTIRYHNSLPKIPVECKHLRFVVEMDDFSSYVPTTLEDSFKLPLPNDPTFGVNADTSLPEVFYTPKIDPSSTIPKDLFDVTQKLSSTTGTIQIQP